MLTYFRVNDPYRILGIFLLLIIVRLPFLINGPFLTNPELKWMLIGEKLSADHFMYVGVWDYLAPLSSYVYFVIYWVFGKSQVAFMVLSTFLIAYQSYVFNDFLLRNKAYNENTYVPAFIYALLSCCFVDFLTLSPALMSLTWLLLGFRNLFDRIDSKSSDDRIFNTGLFLGLSVLFYFPAIVFIVLVLIAYMLFTSILLRRYILMLFGIAMPVLIIGTYFYWYDHLPEFWQRFFGSYFTVPDNPYVNYLTLLVIGAVPVLFLIFSLLKLLAWSRYTSYQERLQYLMLLMLIGAWVSIYFTLELAPYHLVFFIPPVAFFITHYFLLIRKTMLAEFMVFIFLGLLLVSNYATLNKAFGIQEYANLDKLFVKGTAYDSITHGKKIVVLGDNLNVYNNSSLATPYLNWSLSKDHLENWQYYENLSVIFTHFKNDRPEVIVDQENIFPSLQGHIPYLKENYRKEQEDVFLWGED